jgi:hypothetical protein
MSSAKPKPTDVTGRTRAALAEQFAQDQADRANEMSMVAAKKITQMDEAIDATVPGRQTVIVDSVERVAADEEKETVTIRVVQDIEHMTLGAGTDYNFKAGQKYEVTRGVALHLEEKGYLAGVI